VDFGTFAPSASGREFVEVNISSSLISLVSHFVEREDADLARLLRGLQAIRVNVIGLDNENRSALAERVKTVRQQLDSKGWERVVTAQQRDQDVGVYLKTQGGESVQGLTVVVMEGDKQAVFVNVVGDIRPEQVSKLAEKFNIEPLKKIAPQISK